MYLKLIYTNVSPCLNDTSGFERDCNHKQLSLEVTKESVDNDRLGKAFRVDRRLVIRDIERDQGLSKKISNDQSKLFN